MAKKVIGNDRHDHPDTDDQPELEEYHPETGVNPLETNKPENDVNDSENGERSPSPIQRHLVNSKELDKEDFYRI